MSEDTVDERRVRACVNACEGIPTDHLEGVGRGVLALHFAHGQIQEDVAAIEAYVNGLKGDLTEALRLLREVDEWADNHSSIFVWERDARDTLAEDEGWAGLMQLLRAFLARFPEPSP